MALALAVLLTAVPTGARAATQRSLAASAEGMHADAVAVPSQCPPEALSEGRRWSDDAPVHAPAFSSGPSTVSLDLRLEFGASGGALRGTESTVTLGDDVGWVRLALSSGDCTSPTLSVSPDGSTLSGSGTWEVVPGTEVDNAFRDATGSGTFALTARIVPGAKDNTWSLRLAGGLVGATCSIDLRGSTTGVSITGTMSADRICGSRFADEIEGLGGDDQIFAGSGSDAIRGNAGNDVIAGGAGDDMIATAPGRDAVDGGEGSDRCSADVTTHCERGSRSS